MNQSWKQWEGQVVNGEFHLRQFLGGSAHSAVFLTERSAEDPQKAAIKLIPAGSQNAEIQLSRWALAASLSHANLLRIFDTGRCRLDHTELLYVVTEYADEDLSQIIPQRPLTPAEARDMLDPVLDALLYLHGKGLAHGHIKPANLMAVADQLKISSDGICEADKSTKPKKGAVSSLSAYDPPEAATAGLSPAGDVWSLGMTLVEVLTQQLPVFDPAGKSDPSVSETIPQPFLDIARHSLHRDPHRRWTVGDIAARLQRKGAATPAPESVPLSPVPPLSRANQQTASRETPQRRPVPPGILPQPSAPRAQKSTFKPHYVIPAIAVAVFLVAFLGIPKLLDNRTEPRQSSSAAPVKSPFLSPSKSPSNTIVKSAPKSTTQPKPAPPAANSSQSKGSLNTTLNAKPDSASPAPAPALLRSEEKKKSIAAGSGRGEVLEQVLPEVSAKARDTIHGTVRVSIKVQVDRSGSVIAAAQDEPASSKFFSDLALKAARNWTFQPPEVDARAVPSEWLLRFYFTSSTTKAIPEQTAP